jgi:hypothetical protein
MMVKIMNLISFTKNNDIALLHMSSWNDGENNEPDINCIVDV